MRLIQHVIVLVVLLSLVGCHVIIDKPPIATNSSEPQIVAPHSAYADSTVTRMGETAPDVEWTTLTGDKQSMSALKGSVVLVNLFAVWCGPCVAEMPYLEERVWKKFKEQNFTMVAAGREESAETLIKFSKKYALSFPITADTDRSLYARFATKYVPRNYVVDRTGKIVYQSVGFNEENFDQMVGAIQQALKGS